MKGTGGISRRRGTKIGVAMESQNRFEKNGPRSQPVCRSKLESEVSKYALRFRFIRRDCESFSTRQTRQTGCSRRVIYLSLFADEIFRSLCTYRVPFFRVFPIAHHRLIAIAATCNRDHSPDDASRRIDPKRWKRLRESKTSSSSTKASPSRELRPREIFLDIFHLSSRRARVNHLCVRR